MNFNLSSDNSVIRIWYLAYLNWFYFFWHCKSLTSRVNHEHDMWWKIFQFFYWTIVEMSKIIFLHHNVRLKKNFFFFLKFPFESKYTYKAIFSLSYNSKNWISIKYNVQKLKSPLRSHPVEQFQIPAWYHQ